MPNKFKRNVIIAFGISLLLLLLSSVASFISIRNLISSAGRVEHTNEVISELESFNSLLQEAESSQRGYLLTGDPFFLQPYEVNRILVRDQLGVLRQLTSDNPLQQKNIDRLNQLANLRFDMLNLGVQARKEGKLINNSVLKKGKEYMDEIKSVVRQMEQLGNKLLSQRTETLQKLTTYTPLLIIFAAILSIIITIFFYGRIISDFRERELLREELQRKDEVFSKRLAILQEIAEKISTGNYKVRISDDAEDLMGNLAGAVNKMAETLDSSFGLLSDKEWLQAGVAGLNDKMLGEQEVEQLGQNILDYVVNYTNSKAGALYLVNENNDLVLKSTFALNDSIKRIVKKNEGIAGQAAADRKLILLEGLSNENFAISSASGSINPRTVVAIPILHDGSLKGVIELGTLDGYNKIELQFLDSISTQTGMAINTSQNRMRVQELLEETQSQSEEMQIQHSELEHINETLKSQTQKLYVSEDELRVQQEELIQINTELEERTSLLEEKNQMIEKTNREIQLKARELELSAKYKSEFLANMSHELRTPLNSILLLSRLMVDNYQQKLDNEQIEYAKVIEKSGQGLLSLIDEILDLSKIEAGKMEINYQKIAVKGITNDIRSLFDLIAKEKNIDFNIKISRDIPAAIETDKMRLEQILKNLISNAIKFTAEGHVDLSVTKDTNDYSMLVFAVKDTGIGIPSDKQDLIFEAFQQADGSTKRQYGGTGLGLSISRDLAKLLGGRIELSSEPGKGSEFRLFIPLIRPPQIERLSDEPSINAGDPQDNITNRHKADERGVLITEDDTSAKMTQVFQRIENVLTKEPNKVLIVEENPVHARALSYFLENFNISPEIKSDIKESINALLQKEVSCVILDMDTINGQSYDSLEEVKKTPGLEDVPIIIFTGKSLSKLEEGRMKQYANSIIIKTAHSYQRILDEVSLFLHQGNNSAGQKASMYKNLGKLTEVLKDKKVMIADDDVRNIFSLSRVLESAGMNIISATDGEEALMRLQEDPSVDIILMDMMMPEMDGYETMKKIRSMHGLSKLPIIAVTAKAMASDRQKCISAGASDYITKPVDKDQLMSLLRVWLYDTN